jgi:hypothetical protein
MRSGYYRRQHRACRQPDRVGFVPDAARTAPASDQTATEADGEGASAAVAVYGEAASKRPSASEEAAWFAQLPTMFAAAAALFTDEDDRVLLVKPNYRDHWSLAGGILEHGE